MTKIEREKMRKKMQEETDALQEQLREIKDSLPADSKAEVLTAISSAQNATNEVKTALDQQTADQGDKLDQIINLLEKKNKADIQERLETILGHMAIDGDDLQKITKYITGEEVDISGAKEALSKNTCEFVRYLYDTVHILSRYVGTLEIQDETVIDSDMLSEIAVMFQELFQTENLGDAGFTTADCSVGV